MSNYCITIYFCYQLCIKSIKKSISLKILTRFARECENSRPDFCPKTKNPGFSFRHYFVSTVGTDEEVVRAYIRDQEKEDERIEQLSLFK